MAIDFAKMESVARAICSVRGIDPDARVMRGLVRHEDGLSIFPYNPVANAPYGFPAWQAYREEAVAAIEAVEAFVQANS